jgi:hypothetical protein
VDIATDVPAPISGWIYQCIVTCPQTGTLTAFQTKKISRKCFLDISCIWWSSFQMINVKD